METSSSARALSSSPVQTTSMDDLFDKPAKIRASPCPGARSCAASTGSNSASGGSPGGEAKGGGGGGAKPHDGRPSPPAAAGSGSGSGSGSDQEEGVGSGFRVGFCEDRNRRCRRTMEDSHCYVCNFDNVKGQGFFAIFDGHAGKQAADWCGDHFHETFSQVLKAADPSTPVQDVVHEAFLAADEQLNKQRQGRYSGCTAIVVFLRSETDSGRPVDGNITPTDKPPTHKRQLYAGNVGDARAILCRGRQAVRLSYDHKGSDSQEAKRIVDAGGFVMNDRVNGVLAVTRSLGDFSMKEFIVGAPFTVETEISDEDPFLILACDGLWDVCSDQEAVDLVYDVLDPQQASEKLLAHALEKFSTDNLSVMVVRFRHDEQPARPWAEVRASLEATCSPTSGRDGGTSEPQGAELRRAAGAAVAAGRAGGPSS